MTNTTHHRHQGWVRQRGFGLIELSISLTLIAALLLGGFYIVRSIRADTLRKQYSESAVRSLSTASKYLATYRTSAGVSTDLLIDMGGWLREKKIAHPANSALSAARSTIPGAWEDAGRNGNNVNEAISKSSSYVVAYANEAIIYRINKVPSANCSEVIGELARYPSVARVTAKAWTGDTAHPLKLDGTEVAEGTNLNPGQNANVVLTPANITTVCKNPFVEVMALVVRD